MFHWWEEVDPAEALTQGDVIPGCPAATFKEDLELNAEDSLEALFEMLKKSVGINTLRAIVMTQACDLAEKKVRNVVLCPAYTIDEFRKDFEDDWTKKKSAPPKEGDWTGHIKAIRASRIWNFSLLNKRDPGEGVQITTPTLVVDFHEVLSLPVDFLQLWVMKSGQRRLRLLPPYREHLSQAFARFFMRVGLPVDIKDV